MKYFSYYLKNEEVDNIKYIIIDYLTKISPKDEPNISFQNLCQYISDSESNTIITWSKKFNHTKLTKKKGFFSVRNESNYKLNWFFSKSEIILKM